MSSHHIVRDEQEPAVLLAHTAAMHWLDELLQWSPLFLVMPESLPAVLNRQIKIDAWLQDGTEGLSNEQKQLLEAQRPIQRLPCNGDCWKEVLHFLHDKKVTALHLLAAEGQFSWDFLTEVAQQIQLVAFLPNAKATYCPKGTFRKWLSRGIALQAWGLTKPVVSGPLSTDSKGVYTMQENGFFICQSTTGFWVAEQME